MATVAIRKMITGFCVENETPLVVDGMGPFLKTAQTVP